uniref:Putative retroelement pol polyprotein n=1 Tax=Arabidopsis thaliana TaxID=3702 RepID=Q9SLL4_ARATH|nr:putative retroelement pol polyprotein [Arabidopsis thaliana]
MELYSVPSLNISNCVTVTLTAKNYILWKSQFESFLDGQGLLGFVTGSIPAPSQTSVVSDIDGSTSASPNPEYYTWFKTDRVVKSWLLGSFLEDILSVVVNCNTSHEVWISVANHFNRVSSSRLFELQRRLQNVSKRDKSMDEYLKDLKTICDQLASVGSPVTEKMKIFAALNGLGREYEPIKTTIENSMDALPGPSLEDVIPKLTGYDDRLQGYLEETAVSPHVAFNITTSDDSNASGYFNAYNRGKGKSNRGRNSFSTRGRGFHQQISSTNSSSGSQSGGTSVVCQICGKMGHPALKCWHRFNNSYQYEELPRALAAMRITDITDQHGNEWLPDSAATAHVTNSPRSLQQSQPYHGSDAVMVADGNFLPITHTGSTNLASSSGNVPLTDVLVCPSITKSLLSVSKLTQDYPCTVEFDSDGVRINDKATKKLLIMGSTCDGLYCLKDDSQFKAFFSTRQQSASDEVWHRRLGHPHPQVLQQLVKTNSISINKTSKSLCEACQLGKSTRLPFVSSSFTSNRPLERVHCDLWGPSPITSVQGFRYYAVFIDHYSRFSWIYPLKLKSDFYNIFVAFHKLVENQLNHKISVFQCDGGGEFVNHKFLQHLQNHGIQQHISYPHTPQQNGLAERKHRHLVELGLSMLFQSKVPLKFWVEAFFTANFLINLLPTSAVEDAISPYEKLHQTTPDYTALRSFGCACFPTMRDYAMNKFDPRSLKCVFLGYNDKYKGYRCLYPPTGRVYISRHVIFDETAYPFSHHYKHLHSQPTTPLLAAWFKGFESSVSQAPPKVSPAQPPQRKATLPTPPLFTAADFPPLPRRSPQLSQNSAAALVSQPSTTTINSTHPPAVVNESSERTINFDSASIGDSSHSSQLLVDDTVEDLMAAPVPTQQAPPPTNTHPMITRAKVGITKPNPRYVFLSHKVTYPEPKTVTAALKHPGWTGAMTEEMGNCSETNTWSLVPYTPNMHVLGSKWVFRTKLHADGTLNKLKARIVAKCFLQEEGIGYLETYSPVVRTPTVQLVLHLATALNWELKQMDVKNAFLHGDLNETVYMTQPAGFVDKSKPTHVCLLHKSIYGLKQSPRAWFDKFSTFLLEFGFFCSKSDPSLFIYAHNNNLILLLLYVDDMVITGNSSQTLSSLLAALNKEFRMTDMGQLHYFLGIQVQRNQHGLFMSQQKYAEDLLVASAMENCTPLPTPLPVQLDRVPHQEEPFTDPTYFRSIAGKLQYLTLTRPDIHFAVNFVCQKMHQPTMSDFHLLKRILRYIKGTITMGISYNQNSPTLLQAYSDSDWGNCKLTRRSVGGLCTFMATNLVSWSSKKHPTVSRSSTEAEYRTLSDAASEILWLSTLLRELGIPLPDTPELFCDNLSAVYHTANPAFHAMIDKATKSTNFRVLYPNGDSILTWHENA